MSSLWLRERIKFQGNTLCRYAGPLPKIMSCDYLNYLSLFFFFYKKKFHEFSLFWQNLIVEFSKNYYFWWTENCTFICASSVLNFEPQKKNKEYFCQDQCVQTRWTLSNQSLLDFYHPGRDTGERTWLLSFSVNF